MCKVSQELLGAMSEELRSDLEGIVKKGGEEVSDDVELFLEMIPKYVSMVCSDGSYSEGQINGMIGKIGRAIHDSGINEDVVMDARWFVGEIREKVEDVVRIANYTGVHSAGYRAREVSLNSSHDGKRVYLS